MSLILTKDDGTTDVTYQPVATSGSRQDFVNVAASVASPENVMTDHQIKTGKGQSSRHTVSVKKLVQSTDGSYNGSIIASVTISVPNVDALTSQMIYDVTKQLQCSLKKAALDRLVAGASLDGLDLNVTGPFVPA